MRIIDVCAYVVHNPISGGQARVFGFNQALSRYANIEQFSFTPVIMKNKTFTYNKNYKEHIHHNFLYTAGVVLLKLFGFRNYDFLIPHIFWFIRIPRELRKAIEKADIVQVEHPWLLNWVSKHIKKPIILVEHNVEFDLQKNFFNKNIWRKYIVNSIKKNEERVVRKANLVFAMSDEDKKRLSKLYGIKKNKIIVVPNGTRLADYKSRLTKEQTRKKLGLQRYKNIVLFVGAKHPPNEEAADFIENKLAPKMPNILFLIVGNIRKKGKKANIVYCGSVENKNLLPYFRATDIAINPTTEGSGSSIKMFDYLAGGLPIISTKKGIRGIDARPGKDLWVVDLKDFSTIIATLIKDKKLQNTLRRNSKRLIGKYDWWVVAKKVRSYYKQLI